MIDDKVIAEDSEPVHTYFELSYGTHHVLDSKTMAALPQAWHARFQEVSEIYRRALTTLPNMPDRYLAVAATVCEYQELSDEDMHRLKITRGSDIDPDDEFGDDLSFYDADGNQHERWESVYVPDPDDDLLDVAPFRMVWPRTILQSMPHDWQVAFVSLMMQADEVADGLDLPQTYQVRAQKRVPGGWVDIADPVEHYNRGRTRLALPATR